MQFGFIYSRSTPSDPEIKSINNHFAECTLLMGDFNLSHRLPKDQLKVIALCQETKVDALNEITRCISNNQLDYILINLHLIKICFATNFHNFISDHKTITARIGLNGNMFSNEFELRQTFDRESHLKSKHTEEDKSNSTSTLSDELQISDDNQSLTSEENLDKGDSDQETNKTQSKINTLSNQSFQRKFKNIDMATCWLNSCLQLVLTAMDNFITPGSSISELGTELLRLQSSEPNIPLDPSIVKHIIVTAEDTRIAMRLSDLSTDKLDQDQLEILTNAIHDM